MKLKEIVEGIDLSTMEGDFNGLMRFIRNNPSLDTAYVGDIFRAAQFIRNLHKGQELSASDYRSLIGMCQQGMSMLGGHSSNEVKRMRRSVFLSSLGNFKFALGNMEDNPVIIEDGFSEFLRAHAVYLDRVEIDVLNKTLPRDIDFAGDVALCLARGYKDPMNRDHWYRHAVHTKAGTMAIYISFDTNDDRITGLNIGKSCNRIVSEAIGNVSANRMGMRKMDYWKRRSFYLLKMGFGASLDLGNYWLAGQFIRRMETIAPNLDYFYSGREGYVKGTLPQLVEDCKARFTGATQG
jgi:hypothetical protein